MINPAPIMIGVAMGLGWVYWKSAEDVGLKGVDRDLDAKAELVAGNLVRLEEEEEVERHRIALVGRLAVETLLLDAAARTSVRDVVAAIIVYRKYRV